MEVQRHLWRDRGSHPERSVALAREFGLPLLATNGVLYAEPEGQQVLDVMTCARFHTHLDVAGQLLSLNGARCLKSARQMRRLFAAMPEAVANTVRLAERLEFSLENLGYEFPRYRTPRGRKHGRVPAPRHLAGAQGRYGKLTLQGAPATPSANSTSSTNSASPVLPDRLGFGQLRPRKPGSWSRAGGVRPTARSATAWASPPSIRSAATCSSSGSSPKAQKLARHRPRSAQRRAARAGHPGGVPPLR